MAQQLELGSIYYNKCTNNQLACRDGKLKIKLKIQVGNYIK